MEAGAAHLRLGRTRRLTVARPSTTRLATSSTPTTAVCRGSSAYHLEDCKANKSLFTLSKEVTDVSIQFEY